MADAAEEQALTEAHVLPGGGVLVIEPTRALVAVDVDLGPRKGPDPKSLLRQLNGRAEILTAERGAVPLRQLLNTGRFDFEAAASSDPRLARLAREALDSAGS